ncbi:putative C6 transcription factor [Aspergillus nomiae NRRL 13137]|uniref:Putative C6 transcription factor n=1 Tax=Aspergillus nomiae NRRL (strain ATCC 15546 / NRRL 13137 / CBS 260.88 / M93) TaxID=1509407 RepID=A0A0L1ISU6_ASPN3|nr:putative C6 transcription factor [Aspergillus nomiae NRRL 13137]KNG82567.1 putative C6 transcription factor [Aspergillus nomiae NRRL 13137]
MVDQSKQTRKRRRPAFSCTECRRRKVRCDRAQPCNQCTKQDVALACTYEEHPRKVPKRQQNMRRQHTPEEPASVDGSSHISSIPRGIRGTISKTRVFGHGHWMNTVSMMDELSALQPLGEFYESMFRAENHSHHDKISKTVLECKQLARDFKRKRPSRGCLPADLHRSFPDRSVMDELIEIYFSTFESCYRILDLPSFQEEYKSYIHCSETARGPFLLQLAILMTLAGKLHGGANIRSEMTTKGSTWIHIAQTWLSAPLEKDRLTLDGIQINCLLLLARQVTRIGADLVWISAGSLVRIAMQMGLHQDPDCLEEMSIAQKEIRRRLWYTILEINVQSALDSGMVPMITDADYNTQPPSNDEPRHNTQGTISNRMSFQSLLADTLPLRLRAARVINSLQEEPSYDEILALGGELASACGKAAIAIDQAVSENNAHSIGFGSSFCNHLLRRFILCLHYPYAVKAKKNPLYCYSQKVCLSAAQDLVVLLEDDMYRRILLTGGGMFRDLITWGAMLIFLELCPESDADNSVFARRRSRSRQEPLLQDARRVVEYARDRMWHGETNVKVYVCLNMMMALAEARVDGLPAKEAVSKALHESLGTCHALLKAMATDSSTDTMDPVLESWASSGLTEPLFADLDSDFDFLVDGHLDMSILDNLFDPQ